MRHVEETEEIELYEPPVKIGERPDTRVSIDDKDDLSEETKFCEIIHGAFIVSPAPGVFHQGASGVLFNTLFTFVEKHDLGIVLSAPLDVVLEEYEVPQPDIIFIAKHRQAEMIRDKICGAPDLCVEVLSKSTRRRDKRTKFELYEKFGVGQYWIVDPKNYTVDVYRLQHGKFELENHFTEPDTARVQLEGKTFRVAVKRIFRAQLS